MALFKAQTSFRVAAIMFSLVCVSSPTMGNDNSQRPEPPSEDLAAFLLGPDLDRCLKRPAHVIADGKSYFFTWHDSNTKYLYLNWLDARNFCRRYCMDLVSVDSKPKIKLMKDLIKSSKVTYVWTSGRKCDFSRKCDRRDLFPQNIKGWFWAGSNGNMPSTNETKNPLNQWSATGSLRLPQPDNYEGTFSNVQESCMAYLNNYYGDGVRWHDIGCQHRKSFACEDNDELLQYAKELFEHRQATQRATSRPPTGRYQ